MRQGLFGTPEGIRIPDLPLRRRTLYPAELLGHVYLQKTDIYQTVADATDAQQMAKSLALLSCHLHAAFGAVYPAELLGHIACILTEFGSVVKKKMAKWILFHFSSLQNGLFRL